MGKRGTKPLPIALVELNGNRGHLTKEKLEQRKSGEANAQFFEDGEIPDPPMWIKRNRIAREEWQRVCPLLAKMRILTQTDLMALEAYCKCWSRYREAEEELDDMKCTTLKTSTGYSQQLPQISIAQKYLKLCKDFMIEFGMTPSSRGSMNLPSDQGSDEMERLLKESGF